MSTGISEKDWKIFRQLQPLALERFCEQVLFEAGQLASSKKTSAHDRYPQLYRLIHDRDKELAAAFDTPRRSAAWEQLTLICSRGLLTDQEFGRFSPETREAVEFFRRL